MIFSLLLAEKQNVGQQIGTEQRAESFPEDDSRSEDADHNQQHHEVNDGHQYGTEQETDADKQRVFKHSAHRIVEPCEERKDIHQDDGVGSRGNAEDRGTQCPEYIFEPHVIQDISVDAEDNSQSKQDQPYQGALSEVFSERTEKCFRDIAFFVFSYLKRNIEERRGGRAGSYDRNTAEEPQDVQVDAVYDLVDKLQNRAVYIK